MQYASYHAISFDGPRPRERQKSGQRRVCTFASALKSCGSLESLQRPFPKPLGTALFEPQHPRGSVLSLRHRMREEAHLSERSFEFEAQRFSYRVDIAGSGHGYESISASRQCVERERLWAREVVSESRVIFVFSQQALYPITFELLVVLVHVLVRFPGSGTTEGGHGRDEQNNCNRGKNIDSCESHSARASGFLNSGQKSLAA